METAPLTRHLTHSVIRPSRSEIFNRRRISRRSSDVDKFLGRDGKIEGFII